MLEHMVLIVATKKHFWIDSSWLWLSSSTHISHNHSLQWLKKAVDVARLDPRKKNMDTKNDGYWNNVSPASNMAVILGYLSRWLSRNEGMKQSAGFYHAWRIIQVDVSGQEHWSLPLSHGVKGHSDSLKPLTLKNEGSRWKKKNG